MAKKQLIFLAFMFILAISLVGAVPPVTTVSQTTEGYDVIQVLEDYIKTGDDHVYNYFILNETNGVSIDNSSTNCTFFLVNDTGHLLFTANSTYTNYWKNEISGGNFSKNGVYHYGVDCEGGLGGASTGSWEVNPIGMEFTTARSVFYSILLIILGFFFVLSTSVAGVIKGENEVHTDKLVINYKKYVRIALFSFSYGLLLTMCFLASNVAYAFIGTNLAFNIFNMIYVLLFRGLLIAVPVMIGLLFLKILEDVNLKNMFKRGLIEDGF